MRYYLSRILLISVLMVLSGCQLLQNSEQSPSSIDNNSVIAIEELTETEYFLSGSLEHILLGEINRNGQAVGYHYEGVPDAAGEVIDGSVSSKDEHGVYEAKVKVSGTGKESNHGKSTFFPEEWNTQEVVDAINDAYEHKAHINGNTYEGLTDEGIVVRMYLDDEQKIISAFPQY